jgi:hypothetical protein
MMPHSKIQVRRINSSQAICDGCKKLVRVRHMAKYNNKYLCHNCMHKTDSSRIMQSACSIGKPIYTLEKALNKVYPIKTYLHRDTQISSMIGVSNILAGRKVKLILVDEEPKIRVSHSFKNKRRKTIRRRIKR